MINLLALLNVASIAYCFYILGGEAEPSTMLYIITWLGTALNTAFITYWLLK